MKKIIKNKAIIILFFIVTSCLNAESSLTKRFIMHKDAFQTLQKYIDKNYVNNENFASYARITFLVDKHKSQLFKGSTMVYDTVVSKGMVDLELGSISVEKTGCDSTRNFDEIDFDLVDLVNNRIWYYYYDYCDSVSTKIFESVHYKTIPIRKNWFLVEDKGN